MRKYRTKVIPRVNKNSMTSPETWRGGVLQLLGLHSSSHSGSAQNEDAWSQMVARLGGCAEVTFAGSQPWQEPGKVIDARPVVDRRSSLANEVQAEIAAPSWLDSLSASQDRSPKPQSNIHWRHSLDLVPGGSLDEAPAEDSPGAAPLQRGRFSVLSNPLRTSIALVPPPPRASFSRQ